MRNLINLVTFLLALRSISVECATKVANVCKDITSKSKALQLKTHLFCDYDSDVRPGSIKNNATSVGVAVIAKSIDFDDSTNILTLHSWTHMNWTDPFLTWDASDFDGLIVLHVKSSDVWTPDIKVYNSGDASDNQGFPDTSCNVYHDGSVLCIPATKYTTHCDSDYTNFPYDFQNCSIELTFWSYSNDEVNLHYPRVGFNDYSPNQEWEVWELSYTLINRSHVMNETLNAHIFNIQCIMLRRASILHIIFIAPAIVFTVLTLSVLWLDCHSKERMIIGSISFVCHLLGIQEVYYIIPHNGGVSPNLLRFYENSFLLMGLSLVLTVLLRELHSLKRTAPAWLSSATLLVLRSRPGQLLLLSILDPKASAFLEVKTEDNTDLVQQQQQQTSDSRSSRPAVSTWDYVSLLLGWLAFVSVFLIYAVMLATLMPTLKKED